MALDFLGNMFGGGGGGWDATSSTLLNPTTVNDATQASTNVSGGLQQQQAFLNALQAQGGVGNLANVYHQMQSVANGTGPNPAQAQLNEATRQNVNNQAALMASQRGAGANAGLIARQAAMQGANTQQQAAGQAATLGAQQQLGALNQLGGIAQNQIGNQAGALQGLNQFELQGQSNVLNSIAQQNNANVGMQSNVNNTNAQIQGQVAGQQGNLLSGTVGAIGSIFGFSKGGMVPQKMAAGGPVSGFGQYMNGDVNAPTASAFQAFGQGMDPQATTPNAPPSAFQTGQKIGTGLRSAIGNLFSSPSAPGDMNNAALTNTSTMAPSGFGHASAEYNGGMIHKKMADGGGVEAPSPSLGQAYGAEMETPPAPTPSSSGSSDGSSSMGSLAKLAMMAFASNGGKINGKASVKGDSLKNDTVPAMLSPGEVVIPRHVMESDDPVSNAAKFVQAVMAKSHMQRRSA